MSPNTIVRNELLYAAAGESALTSVDVREIHFEAGRQTGPHLHPCHISGYIVEGTARFKIEGQPARQLPAGLAFHEPAETVITGFSNASTSEPMTFAAFYLLHGGQELIPMLETP
jgi:quercetin dioxygenase-like cupin family protein